ncbi:serine hydrolase domain-containing protein [Amnibacterium endophyticum]|uniref:Serine hydrolase domain-containing protein n=1 Tax=Amnibacterium endophyticum TaxID=2109337 RepID=A0ABW4LBZ5_9MICO
MSSAQRVVARFAEAVERERLGIHGVHVLLGEEEAQRRWADDVREDVHSVSKGVSALAAGIAVDEGLLTWDSTIAELLPDLALGDGVEAVRLGHLLTMTSGIDFPWFASQPMPGPDLAAEMLRRPTVSPGLAFQYSDASTYVAMRMLDARAGDVLEWLRPRLFDPLGVEEPVWRRCPLGHVLGGSGLALRTEELARIGRLLRDRGVRRGRRVVPAAWVDGMHGAWISTGGSPPFDRYGVATWAGPDDCWRLDGALGQYVVVDERRRAVVTVTADEAERDHLLAELAVRALVLEA